MTKINILSLAITFALFTGSAFAQMPKESINHLLSENELVQYCSDTGIAGNTRIKIPLSNGLVIYGTITCEVK